MTLTDYLGFAGVSMILLAFFLNLRKKLDTEHIAYILLNTVGALLACMASIIIQYMPFAILEGTWLAVSGYALWKRWELYKLRRESRAYAKREDIYVQR